MAIQDSDPERRNLNVTSLAFIIYFYAGGSFPDPDVVRLQVINAKFSHPMMLTSIVWVMFVWFIYRYWLTHNGDFSSAFKNEFIKLQNKEYIGEYVSKCIGHDIVADSEEGYHVLDLNWQDGSVIVKYAYAKNLSRHVNGKIRTQTGLDNQERIELTDFWGWILAIRATIECFIKYPSFSNYLVPYILAFLAIMGAIFRYVF